MTGERCQILVLDFGSQVTQLIPRAIRAAGVSSTVVPGDISFDQVRRFAPKGIILSGGPSSASQAGAMRPDPEVLEMDIPILGICYAFNCWRTPAAAKWSAAGTANSGGLRWCSIQM